MARREYVLPVLASLALACASGSKERAPDRTATNVPATSLDKIKVPASAVPAHLRMTAGPRCSSIQPLTFYEHPEIYKQMVGVPIARDSQSFESDSGLAGSVLYLQYPPGKEMGTLKAFLPALLWGDTQGPTQMHPEELHFVDDVVVILCFPNGSVEKEWIKDRLRKDFHARISRPCPEVDTIVARFNTQEDSLAALAAHRSELNCSRGQFLVGEYGLHQKDWPVAENGFRQALLLHDAGDPLYDSGMVFATLDGLGLSMAMQGKAAAVEPVFQRAYQLARDDSLGPEFEGRAAYNLACAAAETGRTDEAIHWLSTAVTASPDFKAQARTDDSFTRIKDNSAFLRVIE